MIRKVTKTNEGSGLICLPKEWRKTHISNGWNGKEVKVTSNSKLIIEPHPPLPSNFIVSKTPLRLPLGGGGTDLPEYYTKHEGSWISGAISSYIHLIIKKRFEEQSKFVYSETQYVDNTSQFSHPILRAVLTKYNLIKHIELISTADLPARIGLGSSGSFTVGLLNILHSFLNQECTTQELAEEAYEIERSSLGRKIGKQDQYVAAYGGIRKYQVNKEGTVTSEPVNFSVKDFEKWLLLFYVNHREIPTWQAATAMTNLDRKKILSLGTKIYEALSDNNFQRYGMLLDEHWSVKRKYQPPAFDKIISTAKWQGATGGKLCGAGGGGCILFVCPPEFHIRVIEKMKQQKLVHIPFTFEPFGSEVY